MKLSEHKELKIAVLAMPEREKDKLLLRLVAKDKVLTEHLHFTLLENQSDLDDRVALILESMEKRREEVDARTLEKIEWFPYLIRQYMADINHFQKVTKSDFNEVFLKLRLLHIFWYEPDFPTSEYSRVYYSELKFAVYLVKQLKSVYGKFGKLHEDLQFDLKADFDSLLQKAAQAKFLRFEFKSEDFPAILR